MTWQSTKYVYSQKGKSIWWHFIQPNASKKLVSWNFRLFFSFWFQILNIISATDIRFLFILVLHQPKYRLCLSRSHSLSERQLNINHIWTRTWTVFVVYRRLDQFNNQFNCEKNAFAIRIDLFFFLRCLLFFLLLLFLLKFFVSVHVHNIFFCSVLFDAMVLNTITIALVNSEHCYWCCCR